MKHTTNELLEIVCRYYPKGVKRSDPSYEASDEYKKLTAARREAGGPGRDRWRSLLRRLREELPGKGVVDLSLHLATGQYDACYSGHVTLPLGPGERGHTLELFVSFLVPYYVVCSSHQVEEAASKKVVQRDTVDVYVGNTMHEIPRSDVKPELLAEADRLAEDLAAQPDVREVSSFDLTPEEMPVAATISEAIESIFECARMPPEVGQVIVPEVMTNERELGEATVYDCFFSDYGRTWRSAGRRVA